MPRKQPLDSPLEGAAPTLSPTARPYDVAVGARPPAQSSNLMELGRAFASFRPELRDMLRDAAAREDSDAQALGELDAQKAIAEGRMNEIDTILKKKADSGELAHVRLPAYERGMRTRFGAQKAAELHEDLLARANEATRTVDRVDPETIIAEAYQKVASSLHPSDFYGRMGFEQVARGTVANFRQRVAEGYAKNFQDDAEYMAGQTGRSLVEQLATSPSDLTSSRLGAVKDFLDSRRKELPVNEVNPQFLKASVIPAVEDMIASKQFDEAEALLHRLSDLDLTGKGGLLGKTAEGTQVFTALTQKIQSYRDRANATAGDAWDAQKKVALQQVEEFAAGAIEQARQGGTNLSPSEQDRVINDWSKTLPDSPMKAIQIRAARATFRSEYEASEQDRRKDTEIHAYELLSQMTSLNKEDIDRQDAAWEAMKPSMAPSLFKQGKDTLAERRTRAGVISDRDQQFVMSNVYFSTVDRMGIRTVTPGFGTDDNAVVDAWDKLGTAGQEEHQGLVQKFVLDQMRERTEGFKDYREASLQMPTIRKEVTDAAQKYAAKLTLDLVKKNKKEDVRREVLDQAKAIKATFQTRAADDFDPTFAYRERKGGVVQNRTDTYSVPTGDGPDRLDEWKHTVTADRDLAPVFMKHAWWQPPSFTWVNLADVAKDALQTDDAPKATKAKELYYMAKSKLGFTPEEVIAGETKHGIKFNSSEIDPRFYPVFRNRAELEKHWNNGDPDETFKKLGDLVADPNDGQPFTPERFYRAQLVRLVHLR